MPKSPESRAEHIHIHSEILATSASIRDARFDVAQSQEKEPRMRISVGALVPRLRVLGADPNLPAQYFGIVHPRANNKFLALGGGVRLTDAGKAHLIATFGADDFENVDEMDARFTVPARRHEEVIAFFESPNEEYFDMTPFREMLEELTRSENKTRLPDGTLAYPPVLEEKDLEGITVRPIDISRQPPPEDEAEQITRNPGKPISRRLFYRYEMVITPEVYEKLKKASAIRFFSDEEVATTKGGSKKGVTSDGLEIADNIY